MNDRELIEMAAKAAGYEGKFTIRHGNQEQGLIGSEGISIKGMPLDGGWRYWNPLTDDGDALRLAVKVPNLDIKWIIASAWQACDTEEERNAYVRRAITCATAEIGKAMP